MLKMPESCVSPTGLLKLLFFIWKYGLGVGMIFLIIHFEPHIHVTVLDIRNAKFVESEPNGFFLEMTEGFESFTLQKLHGLEKVYIYI